MKKALFTVLVLLLAVSLTQAQDKGDMGVSVQGGIALPMGDFGDAYDLGFGGTGTFQYYLNKNLAITGTAGYLTWSNSQDMADATFSTIPLLAGVRYFVGKGNFKPYVNGKVGLYFSSSDVTVDLGFFGGEQSVSSSTTDLGVGVGAGFLMPLGKNLNLDVSASYDIIMTSGSSTSFISVLGGVSFAL